MLYKMHNSNVVMYLVSMTRVAMICCVASSYVDLYYAIPKYVHLYFPNMYSHSYYNLCTFHRMLYSL